MGIKATVTKPRRDVAQAMPRLWYTVQGKCQQDLLFIKIDCNEGKTYFVMRRGEMLLPRYNARGRWLRLQMHRSELGTCRRGTCQKR
jgi:hypothetical protein